MDAKKPFWLWLEDAKAMQDRDPASGSLLEVVLTSPGIKALSLHRAAHALWRAKWRIPARMLSQFNRFLTGIEIHPGAEVGRRVVIDHGMGIVVGETAQIGDDCMLYHGVTLGASDLTRGKKRHPTLGRSVMVGAGATVLGSIEVGDGAVVGAGSVVVKSVSPRVVVAGIPAKPIGEQKT